MPGFKEAMGRTLSDELVSEYSISIVGSLLVLLAMITAVMSIGPIETHLSPICLLWLLEYWGWDWVIIILLQTTENFKEGVKNLLEVAQTTETVVKVGQLFKDKEMLSGQAEWWCVG